MKKLFFAALAATLLLSSCAKPDKCKCSFELNSDILDIQLKDQIIERPEDMNCSEIKIEDIKGDIVSIDLSKIGKIKCVNYHE
ncbi:MAG: hypothetical protein IJN52_03205 [Bacteroidales bacterium]|nr:hypothetical protein [Bacteroidales bacterium]